MPAEVKGHCRKPSVFSAKIVQNEEFESLKAIDVDSVIEILNEVINKPTEDVKDDDASGADSEEERNNLLSNQNKEAIRALKLSERKNKKQRTIETNMKVRPHTFIIKNYTRSKLYRKEAKPMQFKKHINGHKSTNETRPHVISEQRTSKKYSSFEKTKMKKLPGIKDILLDKYLVNSSEPYCSFKKIIASSQKKSSMGFNPEGKNPFNSIDDNMPLMHIRTVQKNTKSSTIGKNNKKLTELEQLLELNDYSNDNTRILKNSDKKVYQKYIRDLNKSKWIFLGNRIAQGLPNYFKK